MVHCIFAMMDAWTIPIRDKGRSLLVYYLCLVCLYLSARFTKVWSTTPVCQLWTDCTTRKVIWLSATSNIAGFGAKLMLPFFMGYPYSLLRSAFISRPKEPLTHKDLMWGPFYAFLPRQSMAQRHSEWRGESLSYRKSSCRSSSGGNQGPSLANCSSFDSWMLETIPEQQDTTNDDLCAVATAASSSLENPEMPEECDLNREASRATPIDFDNPFDSEIRSKGQL